MEHSEQNLAADYDPVAEEYAIHFIIPMSSIKSVEPTSLLKIHQFHNAV